MFTIIGGDGKEYGPVTVEQIRGWIAAGRANLQTKAKALGSDEWRALADYAEFAPGGPPVITPTFVPPPAFIGGDAPATAAGPQVAAGSVGARIGAAFINAVLYFVSMIPGSMLMSAQLLRSGITAESLLRGERPDLSALGPGVALAWAGLLVAMSLQVLLLSLRGQNLGKLIVGLRVVRASDGAPAGFVHAALLRFVLPVALLFLLNLLPGLGFLFFLVDFCFIFGEQHRCLHDLIAGTRVVKA